MFPLMYDCDLQSLKVHGEDLFLIDEQHVARFLTFGWFQEVKLLTHFTKLLSIG